MKVLIVAVGLVVIAAFASMVKAEEPYWKPDPQHWKTERTVIDITPNASKWCNGAWGCIHRNPTYYEWDYHKTGNKRPSECVAIVDANLPAETQLFVLAHELCHCQGYTHDIEVAKWVACPVSTE